jgi:hypothetical protein
VPEKLLECAKYKAQRSILADVDADAGKISKEELFASVHRQRCQLAVSVRGHGHGSCNQSRRFHRDGCFRRDLQPFAHFG